jgi:MtrB/PioB family decaheme-associated outer membrane protein
MEIQVMKRHGKQCVVALASILSLHAGGASAQTSGEAQPGAPAETAPQPGTPAPVPPDRQPPAAAGAATAQPDASADAARTPAYDLSVAGGGRWKDVSGSREKFEEYGEVGEGFLLDHLVLRSQRPASGYYMELGIQDPRQDDERYHLTVGRHGAYRVSLQYDSIPHQFATGTFLFRGLGTGRLLIADVAQEQLAANETAAAARGPLPPAPTDPTIPSPGDLEQQRIVRGLYSVADRTRLRLVRRQLGAELELSLPADARAWIRVSNENRDGTRVMGVGSYERWNTGTGLTHTIDRFIVHGAELAEPLDYRTFGAAAGVGIQRDTWLADVEYSLTQFRNHEDVLLWDNPFRVTDAAQVTGGFERSRFAVGQLVLPPNSLSHEVTASASTDLPLHGRLGASVSYGIVTQDDAFFPYTRNSAIIATDLAGNPAGPASTATLPARDLNGDVRTLAASVSASVRPVQPVGVTAKYRAYQYDNQSSTVTFPGYAAFGESGWRRERNDVTAGLDAPVANEVTDYWRHEADLGIDLRLSRMLSVSVDGGWEAWRFHHARLDAVDEYSAGAGFAFKATRKTSLKARYRFSDRTNDGYARGATPENPEARGLLNYNWADRRRHLADARLQLAATRAVSLGLVGRFVNDRYGGKTEGDSFIDSFRFGRTRSRRWLGSADVSFTPVERLALHGTYSFEHRKERMASASKDDGPKATDDFGVADNFAPENYWTSRIRETVNSFGAGATVQLRPETIVLDVGYNLSFSDIKVDTANPNPIVPTTLANAVAVNWPTIKNRLHEVLADLGYRVTPNVKAGVRYLYESYDLDDFAWDIMQPYMAGVSAENSTRYVFADATYNAYQAHVGTIYVSGTF